MYVHAHLRHDTEMRASLMFAYKVCHNIYHNN